MKTGLSLSVVLTLISLIMAEDRELHLIGLFPVEGPAFGQATLVAANLALDHINNRTDILPGYTLRLHPNDTAVSYL